MIDVNLAPMAASSSLDELHSALNNKRETNWRQATAILAKLCAARILLDDLIKRVSNEEGSSSTSAMVETNRKRKFDNGGLANVDLQWFKRMKITALADALLANVLPPKKRKSPMLIELGASEEERDTHANKRARSEEPEPDLTSATTEFDLERELEMLVEKLINTHLGFREVVPKQPPPRT